MIHSTLFEIRLIPLFMVCVCLLCMYLLCKYLLCKYLFTCMLLFFVCIFPWDAHLFFFWTSFLTWNPIKQNSVLTITFDMDFILTTIPKKVSILGDVSGKTFGLSFWSLFISLLSLLFLLSLSFSHKRFEYNHLKTDNVPSVFVQNSGQSENPKCN